MNAEGFRSSLPRIVAFCAILGCGAQALAAAPADPPLISAVKNGQLSNVVSLLAAGHKTSVIDSHGYTPIMYAFSRGNASMVQALLAHGGSIPADTPSFTPLIEAAKAGQTDVVQLLLSLKANVAARDQSGATALLWAVGRNRGPVVGVLLQADADVNTQDRQGKTPLISAAQLGLTALINQLLAVPGIKVDARDRLGYTALMWAAHGGNAAIVSALLAQGADPKLRGKDGKRAADIARKRGFPAIAQSL